MKKGDIHLNISCEFVGVVRVCVILKIYAHNKILLDRIKHYMKFEWMKQPSKWHLLIQTAPFLLCAGVCVYIELIRVLRAFDSISLPVAIKLAKPFT